jgi:virginiamycin B lyase
VSFEMSQHFDLAPSPPTVIVITDFCETIGRITMRGTVSERTISTANSDPGGVTTGPDGGVWFTGILGNKIGRLNTAGRFTEYRIPTANSHPGHVNTGSDGAMWVTENYGNKIGRLQVNAN